jgi:3-oxoacyl-[acyl-carrier-protein] synthase II
LPPDPSTPAPRIAITGYGLVSPLGNSAWETFTQLLAGKTTADRLAKLAPDTSALNVVRAVGGVNIARHGSDPAVELAERAVREALFMADHHRPAGTPIPSPDHTVMLMGSSKGAVHALSAAADQIHHAPQREDRLAPPPPADAPLALALGPHGYLSHHLSRRLGCGPIRQTVAACASSLIALHQARLMLTRGRAEDRPHRVIVMTSEAALLEPFIASYRRLGVIPPLTADAQGRFAYRCKPLDKNRNGFILAEMGAAVVLEPLHDSPGKDTRPTLLLTDTAQACDGYDIIRSEPKMKALSRVAERLLSPGRVDLIHAHATGTREHDPAELAAYLPYLKKPTDVYAVKGALGHGLGAAGLVSVVIACLCAQTGRRPTMPWLDEPMAVTSDKLLLQKNMMTNGAINRQAIFAAGFGGHVAGAVVERV